jgi:hypothetical protein
MENRRMTWCGPTEPILKEVIGYLFESCPRLTLRPRPACIVYRFFSVFVPASLVIAAYVHLDTDFVPHKQ